MVVAFAGSLIGSVEPYLIKTIQFSEVKEKAPAEASAPSDTRGWAHWADVETG